MTDDEFREEGAEDPIEDLEAPASVQGDVAGGNDGLGPCPHKPSAVCAAPTCKATAVLCRNPDTASDLVVYER